MKKMFEHFLGRKKREENGPLAEKRQDRKSKSTRHKTKRRRRKRGDRKGESNDSPKIPDRSETSDIPGLPSGLRSHGPGGVDRRERLYLTLHCHHQNDSRIKTGSGGSHLNVSLIVLGNVTKTVHVHKPQHLKRTAEAESNRGPA